MANLTLTHTWPSTLPLPFIDYDGSPVNATLVSDISSAKVIRRSRFTKSYIEVSVNWHFSEEDLSIFEEFYGDTLKGSISQFQLTLCYPKGDTLTDWAVRFIDAYESWYEEGIWQVTANLNLIQKVLL